MGDDGIGLRLIEHVSDLGLADGFDAVEVGNDGMLVLTYFTEETERLVLVDAVRFGGTPGDFTIFSPEDVESHKTTGGISTHEGDILKLIGMAREIGLPVPAIRIVAIEPAAMQPDTGLSSALQSRFEEYLDALLKEISP